MTRTRRVLSCLHVRAPVLAGEARVILIAALTLRATVERSFLVYVPNRGVVAILNNARANAE